MRKRAAYFERGASSMTTTSSTLKTAAVRDMRPATAVASSLDCVLSMTAAETAMERVGGLLAGWTVAAGGLQTRNKM
jgi:hypothetical protein